MEGIFDYCVNGWVCSTESEECHVSFALFQFGKFVDDKLVRVIVNIVD
jgi:hypothetical protein